MRRTRRATLVQRTAHGVAHEMALSADGSVVTKDHTVWLTRFGPVVAIARAGLNRTARNAYALQDANAGNVRAGNVWLGFARATSVGDMRSALQGLGIPWVHTIAADRHGNALYAGRR